MSEADIVLTIAVMSLATMVPRVAPFLLVAGRELPPRFVTWLRYVPVAVLAAMLAPELFLREGKLVLGLRNLELWVALPTFGVAAVTRNLFLTIATGMGLLALLRGVS